MKDQRFPELAISIDELRALQLTRLRQSIGHAYTHQAPYRAKCQAAGVRPEDLRKLDELRQFPFTEKRDLRDAYPLGLLAVGERCNAHRDEQRCEAVHDVDRVDADPLAGGEAIRENRVGAAEVFVVESHVCLPASHAAEGRSSAWEATGR